MKQPKHEATHDEWAKHIAKVSKSSARANLTAWQEKYNELAGINAKTWDEYNTHFYERYCKNACVEVAKELEESEADFEYACLVYWQNTGKSVPETIDDITSGLAVFYMMKWIQSMKPEQASTKTIIMDEEAPEKNLEAKDLFKPLMLDYQKYIDVLKNVKPAIINENGEFIRGPRSKRKGSIVAWYDILERKGLINLKISMKDRVFIINKIIQNLDINSRSFSNLSEARTEYYDDLLALISRI